jgi:hypothetical protein
MQRYLFSAYHFPVLFQTATFEMQRYLFSAYHFPVPFQTANFEMQRYLFSAYHFPVLKKNQNVFQILDREMHVEDMIPYKR